MTSECSHLAHNKTLVNSVLGVKQTTSDNYVVHWKTVFNKEDLSRSIYPMMNNVQYRKKWSTTV